MKLDQVFHNYFNQNKKFKPAQSKFLIAVSGGIDSMVLLDLSRQYLSGRIAVAHVNYQLRGNDSNKDERLVSDYCNAHNIPFYARRIEHDENFGPNVSGIQEKARQIRYNYFNTLLEANGYDYILTAHHQEDSVETLLLNLTRGSGLTGAKAIPASNGVVIRPLLFATRSMIEAYATEYKIQFRDDVSNFTTKYHRNKIRLNVLPVLTEINKEANAHLFEFSQLMRSSERIVHEYFATLKSKICTEYFHGLLFEFRSIIQKQDLAFYLHYLLNDLTLTRTQYQNMAEAIQSGKSGILFETATSHYCVHQEKLIQFPRGPMPPMIDLELTDDYVEVLFGAQVITFTKRKNKPITFCKDALYIDAKKSGLKVQLKSAEIGDSFSPYNLKGKSVSVKEYMNQKNIPLIAKPWIPILTNDSSIVAIVGIEIAYQCKVDEETEYYWEIKMAKTISPA